jgi:hypothetical protein
LINLHEQPAQPFLPSQSIQRPSQIAFRLGAIFGAIWAANHLLQTLFLYFLFRIIPFVQVPFWINWINSSFYLAIIILPLCSGILASKRTGKITTGIFANLWTFFWWFIGNLILIMIYYSSISAHLSGPYLESSMRFLFVSYMTSLAIFLVLSAALGVLGGWLGRWLWRREHI